LIILFDKEKKNSLDCVLREDSCTYSFGSENGGEERVWKTECYDAGLDEVQPRGIRIYKKKSPGRRKVQWRNSTLVLLIRPRALKKRCLWITVQLQSFAVVQMITFSYVI